MKERPLARVTVLEISNEYLLSAAAICSMLADLGAQVTKLERPNRPDPWRRISNQLFQDLNGQKLIEEKSVHDVAVRAALYRTLADTTMLVTNLPNRALEAWGLGINHCGERSRTSL